MASAVQCSGFAGPYIVGRLSNSGGYASSMRFFGGMSFAAVAFVLGAIEDQCLCDIDESCLDFLVPDPRIFENFDKGLHGNGGSRISTSIKAVSTSCSYASMSRINKVPARTLP